MATRNVGAYIQHNVSGCAQHGGASRRGGRTANTRGSPRQGRRFLHPPGHKQCGLKSHTLAFGDMLLHVKAFICSSRKATRAERENTEKARRVTTNSQLEGRGPRRSIAEDKRHGAQFRGQGETWAVFPPPSQILTELGHPTNY